MPKINYTLEKSAGKRLEISYTGYYKDVQIIFDGTLIDTIENEKELKKGRSYTLKDKTVLHVQLVKKEVFVLEILHNGVPLPGSATDPLQILKLAYSFIYFLGILNIAIGLCSVIFKFEFLNQIGASAYSIAGGILMFALGYCVFKQSRLALATAIGIFILDGILGMYFMSQQGIQPSLIGIGARIVFIIPCFQGFKAIKQIKEKR